MKDDAPLRQAALLDQRFQPLAALVRDGAVESVHRGAIAAVDATGSLRSRITDAGVSVLLRSVAKPFQTAAVIESGAAEAFALTDEEIAVMAGSHAGQAEHSRVLGELLGRCGIAADDLVCGALTHMCSGKHAGMILLARHLGVPSAGYQEAGHPVQRYIAEIIEHLLDRRPSHSLPSPESKRAREGDLFAGLDGCGVPMVRLPLDETAWLYALLARGATPALARVRDAMIAHPRLVGGRSRHDTRVMEAAPGRVIAKGGAEGIQALAILPGVDSDSSWEEGAIGYVFKVEDGSTRPVPLLTRACLQASEVDPADARLEQQLPRDEWSDRALSSGKWVLLVQAKDLREGDREIGSESPGRVHADLDFLPGTGKVDLIVGRGDEKEIVRFLRDEWPLSDEETFGRQTRWIAEPYALVLRQRKAVLAVLKGHFLAGLASIDEFMVGRAYRGRGIGEAMLARFEEEARLRGCKRVTLRAVKGGRAEYFYRRLGYETECVQLGYEFGEDFIRLTHRIAPAEEEA